MNATETIKEMAKRGKINLGDSTIDMTTKEQARHMLINHAPNLSSGDCAELRRIAAGR